MIYCIRERYRFYEAVSARAIGGSSIPFDLALSFVQSIKVTGASTMSRMASAVSSPVPTDCVVCSTLINPANLGDSQRCGRMLETGQSVGEFLAKLAIVPGDNVTFNSPVCQDCLDHVLSADTLWVMAGKSVDMLRYRRVKYSAAKKTTPGTNVVPVPDGATVGGGGIVPNSGNVQIIGRSKKKLDA
jgi:hypothetical protein